MDGASIRRAFKLILMVAITPLPSKIKIGILRGLFGFDISSDAYIGLSVLICTRVVLESKAVIGHLSVIRGDMTLHMKAGSSLGQFNWITGGNASPRYFQGLNRNAMLILGEQSSITSRHILDCTDTITIGQFTTIAGYRSSLITHGIDIRSCKQVCTPIIIGDFCLIGSNVIVLMGAKIANRTIIGAGSVVTRSIDRELGVWGGAPVRLIKELTGEEGYFLRKAGHIY